MIASTWLRRPGSTAVPWLIDGGIVVALLALILWQLLTHVLEPGQRASDPAAYALSLAMVLPFLAHRRAPLAAAAVVLGALLLYSVAHYGPYPGINVFVLVYGVALHSARRQSLLVFAAALGALSVAVWAQPLHIASTSTWISTLLCATVAWLAGRNLRGRRARWEALEERARYLEREREERARQAVTEERLRIARELHDVVAHSMSVIAVQSGVGHHVLDTQPEEARRALAVIETTSRTAMTEMRRLLGVLRQDGQPHAALAPSPGLSDVDALIAQVADAGLAATVHVEGSPGDVPPAIDLSAYRIVQEALTNAIKHGGRTASVTISYSDRDIGIDVSNDAVEAGSGARSQPAAAGHGILGMRERVAIFGGQLSAGPKPGGGFRVAARLPIVGSRS